MSKRKAESSSEAPSPAVPDASSFVEKKVKTEYVLCIVDSFSIWVCLVAGIMVVYFPISRFPLFFFRCSSFYQTHTSPFLPPSGRPCVRTWIRSTERYVLFIRVHRQFLCVFQFVFYFIGLLYLLKVVLHL